MSQTIMNQRCSGCRTRPSLKEIDVLFESVFFKSTLQETVVVIREMKKGKRGEGEKRRRMWWFYFPSTQREKDLNPSGRFTGFCFPSSRRRRVVPEQSDNWVSADRLLRTLGLRIFAQHPKSHSTSVDLHRPRIDTTGGAEMSEAARGRLVLIWRVGSTNAPLSRCFMTPVFTGLQAGCQTQTGSETF